MLGVWIPLDAPPGRRWRAHVRAVCPVKRLALKAALLPAKIGLCILNDLAFAYRVYDRAYKEALERADVRA